MKKVNITLAGRKDDPYFLQCKTALSFIKKKDPYVSSTEISLFETEWEQYLFDLQKAQGGLFLSHKSSPLVYLNDFEYIGGTGEFLGYADEHYDYRDFNDFSFYIQTSDENLKKIYNDNPYRKYCYMDIKIGKSVPVTVVFELYCDIAPITCHNFIELCKGFTNHEDRNVSYEGSKIHRVVPQVFVQGGRIKKGSSVYGKEFADESFSIKHDSVGILGMAKRSNLSNTNEVQFYVTLAAPLSFMNKRYVAFGRVVQGFRVFRKMEKLKTKINQKPGKKCKIVECGVYDYEKMKPHIEALLKEEELEQNKVESDEEKSTKEKKKKKKHDDVEEEVVKKAESVEKEEVKKEDNLIIPNSEPKEDHASELNKLVKQLEEYKEGLEHARILFAIIAKYLSCFPLLRKFVNESFNQIDIDGNNVLSLDELAKFFNESFKERGLPPLGTRQALILMVRYDRDRNGTISRKEFIPYIIDFFKLGRQSLIIEYADMKADDLVDRFRDGTQWDPKGIAEVNMILMKPKDFYVKLRKCTLSIVNPIPEEMSIDQMQTIYSDFCKIYGLPELTKKDIEEIIKDTYVTDRTDAFNQGDLRIIATIVINISAGILSRLTA